MTRRQKIAGGRERERRRYTLGLERVDERARGDVKCPDDGVLRAGDDPARVGREG